MHPRLCRTTVFAKSVVVRHVQEKNSFKGPYNVPKRRAKKHPLAPKRPMSAFLKFSQKRRAKVKAAHPSLTNTDISKILGEMWRTAPPEVKEPYEREEKAERAEYKVRIKTETYVRVQEAPLVANSNVGTVQDCGV